MSKFITGGIIFLLLVVFLLGDYFYFFEYSKVCRDCFSNEPIIIQEDMGVNQRFYVSGNAFEIEPGEKVEIYVGVQNLGAQGINDFRVEVEPSTNAKDKFNILTSPSVLVAAGERQNFVVIIRANKGLTPETDYTFIIKAIRDNNKELPYDSQAIIVTII